MSIIGGTDVPTGRPRQPPWEPLLLKKPRVLADAHADWRPSLLRQREISALTLVIALLALQWLIPARLVLGGLGAVGRPAVAMGILLVFLWFISAIRNHQLPPERQPIRWVIACFIVLQMVGYIVGYDRGLPTPEASSADRWMIYVFAMAGLALAVADGIRTRRELDRLMHVLVGLTAVMAFIGALQFFRIIDLVQYIRIPGLRANQALIGVGERGDGGFARVASTAAHYIEFGVVLALVLPIAVHYALFAKDRARVWHWIAAGLIAAGIPFSISRSATLAVALVMALAAVIWPWRHRYNALAIAIMATMTFHVLQPGVLGTIKSLFVNADNDPSVQGRLDDTAYVMELWHLRPWLGRGAGTIIPDSYILLDNQIYATLLAGGVVGVAGLLVFFLAPYFIGRSIRLRASTQETRHLGHTLAIIMPVALVVSATFDSFSFATFTTLIFLVIGALGALWRLEGMSVHRPLQHAAPGDKFVASPLMVDWRPTTIGQKATTAFVTLNASA